MRRIVVGMTLLLGALGAVCIGWVVKAWLLDDYLDRAVSSELRERDGS